MRTEKSHGSVMFGPFRFEPGQGLWREEREVPVPPRALGILEALTAHPGTVVSKAELLDAVWRDAFVTEASLLEAIRVLRDALQDDRGNPAYIQTVHRRGYRFIAPVTPLHPTNRPAATTPATNSTRPPLPIAPASHALSWGPAWYPHAAVGVVAAVAAAGIAIAFSLFGERHVAARPTMRFTIPLPEHTVIDPMRGTVAISPDGTRVVYVALVDGRSRLFVRSIDQDMPSSIDGSDGAAEPFFSPDGRWVAFFADGSLKKLPIEGGTPVILSPARRAAGGMWLADGTIVFGGASGGGLSRVSEDGGPAVVLLAPRAGAREVAYGWPDVLPGAAGLLYTVTTVTGSRVTLFEPETGESRTLVDAAAFGRYSPTGHLIFERRGRLEAMPFSLRDRRSVAAAARPIVRGVATGGAPGSGPRFAFANTGSLIYVPAAPAQIEDQLLWLDVGGRLETVSLPPVAGSTVDLTPDLQRVAIGVETDAGPDLWIGDLPRGALSRLSTDGRSTSPTWRPDGLEIAFAYSKAGPFNIFVRPADREAAARPLVEGPWNQVPTSWSADGRWLAFTEFNPMTGEDIWILDVANGTRRPVVRTAFDESHARFSPDGRWLAYMSAESGRWEVFVRSTTADGPRVQVSAGGGAWPAWSVDGRTLYFSSNDGAAAAAVGAGETIRVSAPLLIPGRNDLQVTSGRAAANRVLVRRAGLTAERNELRVVVEWFTELARLARTPA